MTITATSQGLKPGVCTSSTRPASPFDGMVVYETDTNVVSVYDGAAWVTVGPAAGRNLVINGNMEIAQRGTTASVASGGGQPTFGADRFWTDNWNWSAGSNLTISQDTSAPTGFHRSYKIATGATGLTYGSGGRTSIVYRVEGFDISPNYTGNVVLSFWVRSSITGTYNLFLENANFGSSTTTRAHTPEYTISVADTWEKKTVIIAMATATASGAWSTTNTIGLGISWLLGAHANRTGDSYKAAWTTYSAITPQTTTGVNWATNANATFHLSGVQLEAGSVVTPFEQRHVAAELALCQRYYQKSYSQTVFPAATGAQAGIVTGNLLSYATNQFLGKAFFPVIMRTTPTVTVYSYTSGTTGVVSDAGTGGDKAAGSGTVIWQGENGFSVYNLAVSYTSNYGFMYHYTAVAEL